MYDLDALLALLFHRATRSSRSVEDPLMPVVNGQIEDTVDSYLDARALTEYTSVFDEGEARSRDAPGLYTETPESGSQYLVEVRLPARECLGSQYRSRIREHIRRVLFATGRRFVPSWIEDGDVDPQPGVRVDNVREVRT